MWPKDRDEEEEDSAMLKVLSQKDVWGSETGADAKDAAMPGCKNVRVVILAGGKGTRLRPYTANFPKPLVPVGDRPILDIVLGQLHKQGFKKVTLALGHLSALIRSYIAEQKRLTDNLDIDYVTEEAPTGTAGSLSFIDDLDDTFLVMNGDVLTDLDYTALLAAHRQSGARVTIAAHAQKVKIDLGLLEADQDGKLTDYIEKPEYRFDVSMGVYVYEPSVLKLIEHGEYLDFPTLIHRLLDRGEPVHVYRNDAAWLDIGRPDDYQKAQDLVEADRARFGL